MTSREALAVMSRRRRQKLKIKFRFQADLRKRVLIEEAIRVENRIGNPMNPKIERAEPPFFYS